LRPLHRACDTRPGRVQRREKRRNVAGAHSNLIPSSALLLLHSLSALLFSRLSHKEILSPPATTTSYTPTFLPPVKLLPTVERILCHASPIPRLSCCWWHQSNLVKLFLQNRSSGDTDGHSAAPPADVCFKDSRWCFEAVAGRDASRGWRCCDEHRRYCEPATRSRMLQLVGRRWERCNRLSTMLLPAVASIATIGGWGCCG
jgi:hypothetical protein